MGEIGPLGVLGAGRLTSPPHFSELQSPEKVLTLVIKVTVRSNESLEAALRRFKRQCNYSGVFRLAKQHAWHEKRSDKRRREGRARLRTIQRATRAASQAASGQVKRVTRSSRYPNQNQNQSDGPRM